MQTAITTRQDASLEEQFADLIRREAADRLRRFTLLGMALVVFFVVLDAVEARSVLARSDSLAVNIATFLAQVALRSALERPATRRHVFGLTFLLCVVVSLALTLSTAGSLPASRLAFLFQLMLCLTVVGVEWPWPWQLSIGLITTVCMLATVPRSAIDYAFFGGSLVGITVVTSGMVHVLVRRRFAEFETAVKLRHANQVKNVFLGTMSHELRTPLNIIVGYSDLLCEGAMGSLAEEQLVTVVQMRKAALQLLTLVENTLNVARLEAGRVTVDERPLALGAFVAELRREASLLPGAQGEVAVVFEAAPDLYIEIDELKLREIIFNLVGNALKFTHRGEIRVSLTYAHAVLNVSVADTGIGIPQDRIPAIFDSFEQLDNGVGGRQGGAGLGLYIVKRLVELLHGTIEVDSTVGQGSKFRVTLPTRVLRAALPRGAPVDVGLRLAHPDGVAASLGDE